MNRDRNRQMHHGVPSGGALASSTGKLPSKQPQETRQDGPRGGKVLNLVGTKDTEGDTNWISLNPDDLTIKVKLEGKKYTLKLRKTTVCNNGTDEVVLTLRSAISGEA
jgi:hypothetical protein